MSKRKLTCPKCRLPSERKSRWVDAQTGKRMVMYVHEEAAAEGIRFILKSCTVEEVRP